MLLAARNEGFGGTITTMAVAEEPALKRLLGIPEPFAVAAVLPMGRDPNGVRLELIAEPLGAMHGTKVL